MSVQSLITKEEAEMLSEYASKTRGDIVEIGTYRGGATQILAKANPDVTIWTVENYNDSSALHPKEILKQVGKNAILLSADSAALGEIWQRDIGFLWIDGDHSLKGIKRDLVWLKWVVVGGMIVLHDAYRNKPYKTLLGREMSVRITGVSKILPSLRQRDDMEEVGSVDTCAIFQKVD